MNIALITIFHAYWGVSESTICRRVHKIENILIRSGKFSLPGKKSLLDSSLDADLIVMELGQVQLKDRSSIRKDFIAGNMHEHTLKTQLIIEQKTLNIICLKHGKGKTHDLKLFKNSGIKFRELLKLIADKGYQGIAKIHRLSETPIKKPKGGKLTLITKKI